MKIKMMLLNTIILGSLFIPLKADVKEDVKEDVKIVTVKEDEEVKEDIKEDVKVTVKADDVKEVKKTTKKKTKKHDKKKTKKDTKKDVKADDKKEDVKNKYSIEYDENIDMYNFYIYDDVIYLIFDTEGEGKEFMEELDSIGEIKEVCFYEDGYLEVTFKNDIIKYIDEFNCSILDDIKE